MLNYQKNDMINNLKNFYNEFCGTLSKNNTLIESLKKWKIFKRTHRQNQKNHNQSKHLVNNIKA